MPYQDKREPLTADEATRLANACTTHQEKLVVWTLLDTGLRVADLAGLRKENIDWQQKRLTIYGKGGSYGATSKRRILELSTRIRPLIENHFAIYDTLGITPRTIQRMITKVANRAEIRRKVTPHVLRHTFSVTAIRKGISLAHPAPWPRSRPPDYHRDLPEPLPRGSAPGVPGEVVGGMKKRGTCVLVPLGSRGMVSGGT